MEPEVKGKQLLMLIRMCLQVLHSLQSRCYWELRAGYEVIVGVSAWVVSLSCGTGACKA
jgi:hypothetical protein